MFLRSVLLACLVACALATRIAFKKEGCIEGHGEFTFRVAYFDMRGQAQTAVYQVPSHAQFSAGCIDKALSQKKANLTLSWDKDVLDMTFSAHAVSGKTLSLRNVNYRYYTDRKRFSGVTEEAMKAVHREWEEDKQKIGEWKKKYTCSSLVLPIGGGVQLEIKNMLFEIFKIGDTLEGIEEDTFEELEDELFDFPW